MGGSRLWDAVGAWPWGALGGSGARRRSHADRGHPRRFRVDDKRGGGDAKLAAATALWLGFDHLLPYLVYASLFGGALTLLLIQFRLAPLPGWLARQEWVQRLHRKDGGVPYGIALAAAALAVYPETQWMTKIGL